MITLNDSAVIESMPGQAVHRTYQEKLIDKKKGLERELTNVDNALKLLEDHPDVKDVLEALSKVMNRL